jgi:small subunit ribosomal protein S2
MQQIDLKLLLEAGAHFGHKTNKWHPKASKYIYKAIGDIHIIDLSKTRDYLEKARKAVFEYTANGKEILFVGTKRQAAGIIRQEATNVSAPYISSRWIGGFITNWQEVKKNIDKVNQLEKDLQDKSTLSQFTKREQGLMQRERGKLETVYGGVRFLEKPPDMLFVIDIKKESTVIKEAKQKDIPVVAIVDTNSDSSPISYPIPANDDAIGSISYITQLIAEAYKEGKEKYKKMQEVKEQEIKKQETKKQETKEPKKETKKKKK